MARIRRRFNPRRGTQRLISRADTVLWHREDSNTVSVVHLDVLCPVYRGDTWSIFQVTNKWDTIIPHKQYTTGYYSPHTYHAHTPCGDQRACKQPVALRRWSPNNRP